MTATIEEERSWVDLSVDLSAEVPCDLRVMKDPCPRSAEWRMAWDPKRVCECVDIVSLICEEHREILIEPDTVITCAKCAHWWRSHLAILDLDRL